jgi:hypothetical protein
VEPDHPQLSIVRQCELLGLARSSYYYEPIPESEEDVLLMRLLDEQYTRTPFYGKRKMVKFLHDEGYAVDRKRVRRLMQQMGLETIYPKPHLSQAGSPTVRSPYLLRGVSIDRIDQVWSSDITYIRLARGFVYAGFDYRLVQSLCAGLGAVKHTGYQFLFGSIRSSPADHMPRDFQYRSRRSVYQPGVYRALARQRRFASVGMDVDER